MWTETDSGGLEMIAIAGALLATFFVLVCYLALEK